MRKTPSLIWLRGECWPTDRIPSLFLRRDQPFLDQSVERLNWFISASPTFHDIFAVVKKVHQMEETIRYEFKNKMLIAEAFKMFGMTYPLHCGRAVHRFENSN